MRKTLIVIIAAVLFACNKKEKTKELYGVEQNRLSEPQKRDIKNLLNSALGEKISSVISLEKIKSGDNNMILVWYINKQGEKTNIGIVETSGIKPGGIAGETLVADGGYSVKCINKCGQEECYLVPEGPPPSPEHCSCTDCKMLVTTFPDKIVSKIISYANND